MSKKHAKKHDVKLWRGRPVKPKTPRRDVRGRPPIHPPEDCKRTMVRSTATEEEIWHEAARRQAKQLGLPENKLTIGPWARMVLNQAARQLGLSLD